MAYTDPTFDAGSWITENIADIRLVMEGIYDIHQDASPTLQILMANSMSEEVGPARQIHTKIRHGLYDVRVAPNSKIRFETPDIDPFHQATWDMKRWYASAGTDYEEMMLYGRGNRSRIKLVEEKVEIVRQSLAIKMNYSIFSDWMETITGGSFSLEDELSENPVPPSMNISGMGSTHTNRIFSLPMFTRTHATGHTMGNISSANAYWKTTSTLGTGSDAARATTGDNIDICNNGGSMTTFENLTVAAIRTHLNKVQRGAGTELLCATPADLYDVLEDYLLSERRRGANDSDNASPIMDLGINAVIRMISRNCTFYVDNMMTDLWPNSLFFWSTDHLKLQLDPGMGPWLVPFERIPGGNMYAMGAVYLGNLIIPDGGSRRALSEMHGYDAP